MKILVISNSQLLESQGSGYVIINTARALEQLGHDVKLIPPSHFEFLPFLKSKGTNYRRAAGIGRWILNNRKEIGKHNLIIFYGAESSLGLYFLKNILRKKIRTILHSNGLELHVDLVTRRFKDYLPGQKRWYHFDHKLLFKYCYYHVDSIITVSQYDKDFAEQILNIPSQKVFALEPFLPDVYFSELRDEPVEKKPVITYCGSWISRKGVNIIKEVIPTILRNYPHYKFRLIGVGASFHKEDHFPSDIFSQLEIYPLVTDKKELISLYKDTDIFLFPSFCESFGLVVAEAMLYNCAVVCGPTGLATSLTNRTDAMVLDIPNGNSVMKALAELIENPVLKKNIQIHSSQKVMIYNRNHYVEKLQDILGAFVKLNG